MARKIEITITKKNGKKVRSGKSDLDPAKCITYYSAKGGLLVPNQISEILPCLFAEGSKYNIEISDE